MESFGRVVRMALRQRWTLAGCITSSLLVAVLWGMNIGTIYPMVEVVFAEKGPAGYLQEKIEEADRRGRELREEMAQLAEPLARPEELSPSERRSIHREIELRRVKADAFTEAGVWYRKTLPYALDYLPTTPYRTLLLVIGVLMVGTTIKLIALMCNLLLVQRLSQRVAMEVRCEFFRRALRQNLEEFGDSGAPGLTSRLTNDVSYLATGVSVLVGRVVREPLKLIVCLLLAAFFCWRLLLLVMIVTPLVAITMNYLSKAIRRASRRVMEEMARLYGMLNEAFVGIRVVRAYNTQAYERARFRLGADKYYRKSMRVAFYNASTRMTSELLGTTTICLAFLAGGYLVLNEETHLLGMRMTKRPLEYGDILAFFGFLIGASDPGRKLTEVWSDLQKGFAAATRIFEVIDRPLRVAEPARPRSVARPHAVLEFRDVTFRYPAGPRVLQGIDMRIEHGERLAIVGPNGSGKSTLVGLLCRFDDPESGTVSLDGVPLREMAARDLRRRLGLVTQRTVLFDDTIFNNIRYGARRATEEQVISAARRAYADEFIETKTPRGYDTVLGKDGARLSGGQMQRIALARAFLRNPDILILDEATSQIDLESEQLIHEALRTFLVGRTGIMITHRPSTLTLADRVAVIAEGRVADIGTHEQLIDRNAFYRSLRGIESEALRRSA